MSIAGPRECSKTRMFVCVCVCVCVCVNVREKEKEREKKRERGMKSAGEKGGG